MSDELGQLSDDARNVRDRLKRELDEILRPGYVEEGSISFISAPPETALNLAISASFAALGALAEIERILRRLE